MSSIVISGDTSGSITLNAPAVAGTTTLTLPANSGPLPLMQQGTAVASTSGTSVDFTGIPAWVKRITVMFNGVSTNGTSSFLIQLGTSSGVTTSGYLGQCTNTSGAASTNFTSGFIFNISVAAAGVFAGNMTICNFSGNIWSETSTSMPTTGTGGGSYSAGYVSLTSTLDRVRITTVNGTDTFDAGSINILYEGY